MCLILWVWHPEAMNADGDDSSFLYFKLPFYDHNEAYLKAFKNEMGREDEAFKKLKDTAAMNHPTALPLNEYAGKYVNNIYGHLEVTTGEGNNLEIRFEHHPRMYALLQPLGGNRFFVTFSDPTYGKAVFPFYVQNGKVTGLKMKVADFVEMDPYEFKKE